MAIICRATVGDDHYSDDEVVHKYFNSLARSMFTVFRCSFGDCNTADGISSVEAIVENRGWGFSLAYSIFIFSVTVGLFNIISAIFVDSTANHAANVILVSQRARLDDEERLAVNVMVVIEKCFEQTGISSALESFDDYF
jgi:hypothetical protein